MGNDYKKIFNETAVKHASIMRGPYQMAFDITNKCNLRCMHCYNRSGENLYVDDELNDNEILDFLDDIILMKPQNICFCGGEPLLRQEILLKGIDKLSQNGVMSAMVTNGILVTRELTSRLHGARVSQVQVSLDGSRDSHDRLRRSEGAFDKATKAIEYLVDAGIPVGVAYSPTKWNIDEFEDIYNLLMDLGVSSLRCQPLMAMGRGEENWHEIVPSQGQYRQLVRTIYNIQRKNKVDKKKPDVSWADPLDHLIRFSQHYSSCCLYINIKANGGITPSIYLPIIVGNVRKHRLSDYWEAGLSRIWNHNRIHELESMIRSVSDMTCSEDKTIPKMFWEKELEFDFIDDLLYKEV